MIDGAWHAAAMAGLLAAGLAAGCATAFESTVDAGAGAQDSRPPNPDVGEVPIDAGVDPVDATDEDASLPSYPLAAELFHELQGCTVTLRFDYVTADFLAFQVICGALATVSEEEARQTAHADTGFGVYDNLGPGCDGGECYVTTNPVPTALNPADPVDAFVFLDEFNDFGGTAVVSARTGLTVFGASIWWAGVGEIRYPAEWHAPAHLCQACDGMGALPDPVAYNLAAGGIFEPGLGATAEQALAAAEATGVFQAFHAAGMVSDIVAVLYPRQVGIFDPAVAEWIVIVNGQ
jgi:hypothetical protein